MNKQSIEKREKQAYAKVCKTCGKRNDARNHCKELLRALEIAIGDLEDYTEAHITADDIWQPLAEKRDKAADARKEEQDNG